MQACADGVPPSEQAGAAQSDQVEGPALDSERFPSAGLGPLALVPNRANLQPSGLNFSFSHAKFTDFASSADGSANWKCVGRVDGSMIQHLHAVNAAMYDVGGTVAPGQVKGLLDPRSQDFNFFNNWNLVDLDTGEILLSASAVGTSAFSPDDVVPGSWREAGVVTSAKDPSLVGMTFLTAGISSNVGRPLVAQSDFIEGVKEFYVGRP
jgi:hypothetical protein